MSETTVDIPVLGMTCAACVRRVENAVAALPGVAKAEVNLPLSRARIVLDPDRASVGGAAPRVTEASGDVLRAAADAIREAGYEVPADVVDAIAHGESAGASRLAAIERAEHEEVHALRRDATIAIALAVPLLIIGMAHGVAAHVLGVTANVIVQMVLGTIVVLVPGRRYLRGGWRAVRHGSPDMNTLIALGAGAAWLASMVTAVHWLASGRAGMPVIYFEAGAAIVAFVMIGKVLESRARARLSEAVRGLMSLAPARARRVVEEREEEIDASSIAVGDILAVRPGERIAADGTIVEGRSSIDESMLSGESLPVDKEEGSPAYAGTLNQQGALRIRVARAGADTSLARIARAVEDAQGQKAPIARLADRVSSIFVPAVLLIAVLTCAAWLLAGFPFAVALSRLIAVLVIACPCALGLATPAAVAVGTSRGAELGILFKGGASLEIASRIQIICLDKTGTLTANKPTVVGTVPDSVLSLAASLETHSEHPLARAIVLAARARSLPLSPATNIVSTPGHGISGTVAGHHIELTGTLSTSSGEPGVIDSPVRGASISEVRVDGEVVGTIAIADEAAQGAREAVEALRAMGIEPVMISGDREEAARRVADEVGIARVFAGVRPTGKAAMVRGEKARGAVAMVGDGVNDAPALAAADLGIAMGGGTDIAAAAADVTLLRGGVSALPTAFALAKATMRTIRRNLIAAFAYNLVCIPVAAAGLLSPVLASAAMSLSSVSVLLSSLRLRSWMR